MSHRERRVHEVASFNVVRLAFSVCIDCGCLALSFLACMGPRLRHHARDRPQRHPPLFPRALVIFFDHARQIGEAKALDFAFLQANENAFH